VKFYTHVAVRGSNILYRGYENGKRIAKKVPFMPTLFVPAKGKKTEWQTLDGKYVEPFKPGSIRDAKEFISEYKGVVGFEIFGNTEWLYQYIGEEFPNEVEYDPSKLKVAFIDIETECEGGFPSIKTATERVNAITLKVGNKVLVFGLGEFTIPDAKCFQYDDEKHMLRDFLAAWEAMDIDIVTGWNVNFFDIPYLVNRITRLFDEKEAMRLSPWREIRSREVEVMNKKNEVYDLLGIATLDYFDLYRKFTYVTRETYKLDHIVWVELGERKKHYDGTLAEFYKNDFQKFMEYNHHDTLLVGMLENKLKLMELALALAYSAKVNLNDVFSQVRTWDAIIYHHLTKKRIAIPMKGEAEDKETKFEGAYVKDPIVGAHDWVVSFDLDSLYPHLIMQYNLSPETKTNAGTRNKFSVNDFLAGAGAHAGARDYLDNMRVKNLSVAGNCVAFRKDTQGFLPQLMETMYEERKAFKKKMLEAKAALKKLVNPTPEQEAQLKLDITKFHNFQLVRKIQLNSAFGACGNQYFRYYDQEIAEAITISGQVSIRWIENGLNQFLNKTLKTTGVDYVIASDTDSVYLRLGSLVKQVIPKETDSQKITKFLNKFCNEVLQPFIDKQYASLAEQQNAYAQKMRMKREGISSKGIWTAKKRYMLSIWMGEDDVLLSKPETKIMGLETAKSSTPEIVRDALKKSIGIIMEGTESELRDYVAAFKTDFFTRKVEEIAFPRGCNGLKEYRDDTTIYRKSTPLHVKGALLYNHWLREKNLSKRYPKIGDGEKIKYVYLRVPNPVRDKVISFTVGIPKEFGLEAKYIDYDTQFEKSFEEPLNAILNVIGWHMREVSSLEGLFTWT
jgi:DNA polymerase elongation subunit (family B)